MDPVRCGIFLCNCNNSLPLDARVLQAHLGAASPPRVFSALPRGDLLALKHAIQTDRPDRFLISCCAAEELFRESLAASAIDAARAIFLDLKTSCYWPGMDPAAAQRRAARLIRAAVAGAVEARGAPPLTVRTGPAVLIYTDVPLGMDLARRLQPHMRPTVILDEASTAFDDLAFAPTPWPVSRGRVTDVKGHLGDFAVRVERTQALDLRRCVFCGKCAPICHTQAITPGLRLIDEKCDRCGDCLIECGEVKAIQIPRREAEIVKAHQVVVIHSDGALPRSGRHTGYHVVRAGDLTDPDGLAFRILALVGEFSRPAYLRYDPGTCAAGSADLKGCSICMEHCPYDAIAREGQRIKVEELTCEGCGACTSACPTSSLTFADPSERQVYGQLQALLRPLAVGPPDGGQAILFHCPEQGRGILRRAGDERRGYPPNLLPLEVPCSRFVSEAHILEAFRLGAAGVALLGCEACPHGERQILSQKLDLAQTILEAFGFGADRVAMATGTADRPGEALDVLASFTARLGPAPLPWPGGEMGAFDNRRVLSRALGAFMDGTGREPGIVRQGTPHPLARADVNAPGCTLCGACVFVCPTHAFLKDDRRHTLSFTYIDCVACGMCEQACPERVITLHRDVILERAALRPHVVVQDEMIACGKCGKEYINRRALETIEARVLAMAELGDTFAAGRRGILRMCPDCRGAFAVLQMQEGWEP